MDTHTNLSDKQKAESSKMAIEVEAVNWLSQSPPLLVALAVLLLVGHHLRRGHKLNKPPGPRPLPIIGNLKLLGSLPHRSLQALAQKYGPLMHLRLGTVPMAVISSAEIAEAFLKTHDLNFATRAESIAGKYTAFDHFSVLLAPYGAYWRQARKIYSMKLFNIKSMESYEYIRKEERGNIIRQLFQSATKPFLLKDYVATLNLSIISRMVWGKHYNENDKNDLTKHLLEEYIELNGCANFGDFIPLIGHLDVQGLIKRMKVWAKEWDAFLDNMIDEHIEKREGVKDYVNKDMLDILVEESDDPTLDPKLDRLGIKGYTQDLIIGGIDTSQVAIEWTIAELVKNPEKLKKATEELDKVIGRERWVEEKDIPNIPYITAVVKESLRMHPVVPILVPREAREDANVAGYDIAKGTRLLVNVFAIGRDPSTWENPNEFLPERFIGKDIDVQGHDYELLPFGAGRRMCPAYKLGLKFIQITVANLVHGFHWRLPSNKKFEELNMEESYGLTTGMKFPLQAVIEPRLPTHLY